MTADQQPATGRLPSTAAERPADPWRVVNAMLVVLLTVLTAVAGVYAVFFLPLNIGVVPVPISALIVAAVVFAAVRLCYSLTGSVLAAAAPAAAWLIVSVVLGTTRTFGYPLVISDWRALTLFGLGALAATVAVGTCRPGPTRSVDG